VKHVYKLIQEIDLRTVSWAEYIDDKGVRLEQLIAIADSSKLG